MADLHPKKLDPKLDPWVMYFFSRKTYIWAPWNLKLAPGAKRLLTPILIFHSDHP